MLSVANSPVTAATKALAPTAGLAAPSAEPSSSILGQYHAISASCTCLTARLFPVVVLHHLAALHHKLHPLERGHVLQRIAIDRDDVGPRSRLQASDLARPSQQISRIHGRSLDRLQRR